MVKAQRPVREPKASRTKVWQAVERIVQGGRRPTVEGVRELLGGGSPNSVTAYINEWYQELGSRLAEGQTALSGIPREAISLLSELWSVAASARSGADTPHAEIEGLRSAEHAGLVAEARSLDTLVKELRRQRGTTEQSLADARALLRRREAELEELRLELSAIQESLTHTALERDVIRERLTLRPTAGGRRVKSARRAALRRPKASSASTRASVKRKPRRPHVDPKAGRARTFSPPDTRRSGAKPRRSSKRPLRK